MVIAIPGDEAGETVFQRRLRHESGRLSQPGDVPATYASIDRLRQATGFVPKTSLEDGLARFVAWYRDYHGG